MIGSLIEDRYRIEAEIGRGGMGIVYRAEDTLLERPVAVKVVSSSGLGTEGRNRLLQEARAAARLNHHNIVAVHDVGSAQFAGQEEPSSYIVMELVEGQTLDKYHAEDLDQVIQVAIAMCDALDAAHSEGIIHRDLKPENVIVTPSDTVKLMDFGLARVSGKNRLTEEGTFMGTLSYLAPEIILGQEADERSDLYSFGVLLYEISAGKPPFEADSITAVISQHLYAPVNPPSMHNSAIPPALDEVIVQLLSKRPEDRPVSAREVRSALVEIKATPLPAAASAPMTKLNRLVWGRMVGRESEFSEAVSLWEKSTAGRGHMLMISGEPGIGKTRLVKELSAYVEIRGGTTLTGLCFAEERTPYGPIAQMIQHSLSNGHHLELPQAVMSDLLTLSPELRLSFPDIPPNDRLDPETEQLRLFNSIITWFGALTREADVMMVVDDVHWADSGSLALLRFLARRLAERPALIVTTYREVELDAALPFQQLLADINRERLATRIKLSSLDKDQTKDLLSTIFSEEVSQDFLEGIYRETEGNPFFIEEVCKALIDSGKLYFADGQWQRPDHIEDLEIPQGIRLAIQSRLSKLSTEEQNTLQIAALLGREFEYEMLVKVSDLDEDALIGILEKAEEAQLIEEVRATTPGALPNFAFTHALIHSTLRSNLSTLRRQRMQKRIALALEKNYPEREKELAPLLGRYFAEAGDAVRGSKYLLIAGDSARFVFAYDEAIESYEHALLFLTDLGDHRRASKTLMKLGLTYHNIFDFEASRKAYEKAFAQRKMASDKGTEQGEAKAPAPHPWRGIFGIRPATLDPTHSYDAFSAWCINQLFSGLVELTAEDDLMPDIASRWEVLDEGRKYVFHLREDVVWSDGIPLVAEDFAYAWKRTLDPENTIGLPEILYDIANAKSYREGDLGDADELGIKVVDEHTLEVYLEGPSSCFLQIMALANSKPVPRHIVEQYGDNWSEPDNLVTNGPFRLKSLIDDKELIFEKNETYHGRFGGNVTRVDLIRVPDEKAVEMYEQGELDIIYPYSHLSVREGKRMIQLHPDEYVSLPAPSTYYIVFDTSRAPFNDRRIRQALTLAIDRPAAINEFAPGLLFPATGGIVPTGIIGHAPGIALPYDAELARTRMADGGCPDGLNFPEIDIVVLDSSYARALLGYFTKQWQEILGIKVSASFRNYGTFFQEIEAIRPNMWMTGWRADYPDPDSFLRYDPWLQQSGWRNEQYEMLVSDARGIRDQESRMALYKQAEMILVEEAPVVPIHYGRQQLLVQPWVPAIRASIITGNIPKDIIIEPH